jgi:hypothetical protein
MARSLDARLARATVSSYRPQPALMEPIPMPKRSDYLRDFPAPGLDAAKYAWAAGDALAHVIDDGGDRARCGRVADGPPDAAPSLDEVCYDCARLTPSLIAALDGAYDTAVSGPPK